MPPSTFNLEWLSHNAVRRYPLVDDASGVSIDGSFSIPEDFLVELDLPITVSMDLLPYRFFIRQLGAYPTGYSILISYDGVDSYTDVAMALIPRAQHTRNAVYTLGGIAPYDDTMGKIVVGKLDTIDKQPAGLWEFKPETTFLEADCIRPIIHGVQAIIAVDGAQRSIPLSGDIELVAGTNMRIWPYHDPSTGVTAIRFDAISGEGTILPCVCADSAGPCIRTINGVAPTSDGKFNFKTDPCLEVSSIKNGMMLTDKCCTPCCSCPELEAITSDLEQFKTEKAALETFANQLMAVATQMELTVLGAKLGDKGCQITP